MSKPIRTTVVFALVSGFFYLPLSWGVVHHWYYPAPIQLVIWAQLAVYALLLARWSQTRLIAILFPILLLLAMALLPGSHNGFIVLAVGVLSWIRSGICFQGAPLRCLMAELVTVAGGLTLFLLLAGPSALSWSLGFCLFGLVQSLYFYIVPIQSEEKNRRIPRDPFEHAFQEAQKIVDAD